MYRPDENRQLRRPDIAPDVLLPYQKKWIADMAAVKFCEKSRRIGLSWSEAAEDSLLAASSSGMDVFYIGYNLDMAREFIEDCADWSRFYNLAAGQVEDYIWKDDGDEKKNIQTFRVRYPSGYKINALSSRPANLRGKQGKIVIDEAAFHDDLPGLLKAAMAMLIWGGRVVVISTHFGEDNIFNEKIQDIRAGKLPYRVHRITFDDALEQGLYQRVCLRRGIDVTETGQAEWRDMVIGMYGEDADEELFCIPSKGGGTFLPLALIESAMDSSIPIIRWKPPQKNFTDLDDLTRYSVTRRWCEEHLKPELEKLPDIKSFFGEDFGRVTDLSVFWPIQELPSVSYRTPFVLELQDCPFTQQEQILFYMVDRLPQFSGGALDARGNGAYLAERARQQYGEDRIHEVQLSERWYLENMPPMKAAFEDKTIRIPRHSDYKDDFRAIKKVRGVPKIPDIRTDSRAGGKRHGDAAIAKCMAIFAARNTQTGPIEFEGTGKRRVYAKMRGWL
jgi:phage FluMu gp28-like protein